MFAALVVRRYKLVAYVRSWPNPAAQASIAGCQAENRAAAATGRNRPNADMCGRIVLLAPQPVVEVVLRRNVLRMLSVNVRIRNNNSPCPKWEPLAIADIAIPSHSHVFRHRSFASTKLNEVDLSFDQTTSIRATRLVRVVELEHIVFPETNWANSV